MSKKKLDKLNYKNEEKLKRATAKAEENFGPEPSEDQVLAEYLRLGGFVTNEKDEKIPHIVDEGGKEFLEELDIKIAEEQAKKTKKGKE